MAKKGRAALDREKDSKDQKQNPPSSSSSSSSSSCTASSALPDAPAMDRDIAAEEFVGDRSTADATDRDVRNGVVSSETGSRAHGSIGPREESSAERGVGMDVACEDPRRKGPFSSSKPISLSLPVTLSPTAVAAAVVEGHKEETQESQAPDIASQNSGEDTKMEAVKEEPEAEGSSAVLTCIRATQTSMPTITCNVRTACPFSIPFLSSYVLSPLLSILPSSYPPT